MKKIEQEEALVNREIPQKLVQQHDTEKEDMIEEAQGTQQTSPEMEEFTFALASH